MASRDVRIVVGELERFAGKAIRALVLEIHANLVRAPGQGGTPVRTGWARSNWVPRIATPHTNLVGSPQNVSQAEAQQGLAEVATRYMLRDGPAFISNNVPYIQKLNEGSSAQAPRAFVQAAVSEAVASVARARI